MRILFLTLTVIGLVVVTACGGGGGGSQADTNPSRTADFGGATQKYTEEQAIYLVEAYLFGQTETRKAQDLVKGVVKGFKASYEGTGSGVWVVTGRGTWRLDENTGDVTASDDEAIKVLQEISQANILPGSLEAKYSPSIVEVVKKAAPSVVKVSNEHGSGSGIIIDSAGYILTNSHIIEGGGTPMVTLSDGGRVEAPVLGRDEVNDIAVLKIEAEGLTALPAGALGEIEVGDDVLSIGFAPDFGGDPAVSEGTIISLHEDWETGITYIRTDASIDPGNSGGALVNMKGEAIGMNTFTLMETRGFNTAVATESVQPRIPGLMAGESVLMPPFEPESWMVYDNWVHDYLIEYPVEWGYEQSDPGHVWIGGANEGIWIIVYDAAGRTLDTLVNREIEWLRNNTEEFQILSDESIFHQGVAAREILSVATFDKGDQWMYRDRYILDGDTFYNVLCACMPVRYNSYAGAFDYIMDSFILPDLRSDRGMTSEILLEDNFLNSSSGWVTRSSYTGVAEYHQGAFWVKDYYRGDKFTYGEAGRQFTDFVLEVDVELASGTDNNLQAVICRAREGDDDSMEGYYFCISADGYYGIFKRGTWGMVSLEGPTQSPYINVGKGMKNRLHIECQGGFLSLAVNGHHLTKVTDYSFPGGDVALGADALSGLYTEVLFDNILITSPKKMEP